MDTPASDFPAGDIRVSDAERDRALAELSLALQAGRITTEELDERSGQVLAARTGKELAAPLADLPRATRPPAVAPRTAVTPGRRAGLQVGGAAVIVAGLGNALNSVAHALASGATAAQAAAARAIMTSQGMQVPAGWPPRPGFDWAGTITSAVFAIALIALGVCLLRRANRA
jgi:hypothetical protein